MPLDGVSVDLRGGEHFSIADITLACTIDFAKAVKLPLDFDRPGLDRWYAEVSGRAAA